MPERHLSPLSSQRWICDRITVMLGAEGGPEGHVH